MAEKQEKGREEGRRGEGVGWGIRGACPAPPRRCTTSERQLGFGGCRCFMVPSHIYTATEMLVASSQPLSMGKHSRIPCASLRHCSTVTTDPAK